MREEKYQPRLKWEQDKDAAHIYRAWVDGKQAGCIRKDFYPGMVKVWIWTGAYEDYFKRRRPELRKEGVENTARLAVQRAEEYFDALMAQPIYVYEPDHRDYLKLAR